MSSPALDKACRTRQEMISIVTEKLFSAGEAMKRADEKGDLPKVTYWARRLYKLAHWKAILVGQSTMH